MTRMILTLMLVCIPLHIKAQTSQVRVGVIDTGFGPGLGHIVPLCNAKHADTYQGQVSLSETPPSDSHGHGTHVSFLIHQAVLGAVISESSSYKEEQDRIKKSMQKNSEYCQVIARFYTDGQSADNSVALAIEYMIAQKVDIINISGGGIVEVLAEKNAVKKALDLGIKVVTAAGNESSLLSKHPYFPAMSDKRTITVGSIERHKIKISSHSNYGLSVDMWAIGRAKSLVPYGNDLILREMSGTSQSTAIVTGKLIQNIIKERKDESARIPARNQKSKKTSNR
jgi:subtilisin family serine protease